MFDIIKVMKNFLIPTPSIKTFPDLDEVWFCMKLENASRWEHYLLEKPSLWEETWEWRDSQENMAIDPKTQKPYPPLTLLGKINQFNTDEPILEIWSFLLKHHPEPETIFNQVSSHPKDPIGWEHQALTPVEWMLLTLMFETNELQEMRQIINRVEYLIEHFPLKLSQPELLATKWHELDDTLERLARGQFSSPKISAFLDQQCILKQSHEVLSSPRRVARL